MQTFPWIHLKTFVVPVCCLFFIVVFAGHAGVRPEQSSTAAETHRQQSQSEIVERAREPERTWPAVTLRARSNTPPPAAFDAAGLVITPAGTSALGGFINYELLTEQERHDNRTDGLLELGVFNGFGLGTVHFLAQDLFAEPEFVRLDTTWSKDWPEQGLSLHIGDVISRTGAWGRPVRFGGIELATTSSAQPGYVPFSMFAMDGELAWPATGHMVADHFTRLRGDLPPDLFIAHLPAMIEHGRPHPLLRDELGHKRLIFQPYAGNRALVPEGLQEFSLDIGFIREDFGRMSNDYGRFLSAGIYRAGLSDRLTGELRGEVLQDQQTAGLAANYLWPGLGVFNSSLAVSNSDSGSGRLVGLGFTRKSKLFSFSAHTQLMSPDFIQIGLRPERLATSRAMQAQLGFALGRWGSFDLTYFNQHLQDRRRAELTAGYGIKMSMGKHSVLNVSASHTVGERSNSTVSMTFIISLGKKVSASADTTGGIPMGQTQMQASYNPITGNDIANRSPGSERAWLGRQVFLPRRVAGSFAVVKVPDRPNIRIYADNRYEALEKVLVPYFDSDRVPKSGKQRLRQNIIEQHAG